MNAPRHYVLAAASISCGLLTAAPAVAASLQKVTSWGATGVPTYVSMYIYVPDKLAEKPPILVACHACQGNATTYINNIPGVVAAANKNGFIVIVPEATGKNCWDTGSTKSLTHDGGGDTQAIAQMVKYALDKYKGDATRVYAMGGSSGAMMTQALLAVYPDIFRAGAARAGVPAGCWADGYDQGQQWSGACAGGRTTKTAEQWGDLVRGMYPGFTGSRPRVQLFHGDADPTINFANFGEAIKEWTNVLGLSATPTTTDSPKANHTRQIWKNSCGTVLEAWSIKGGNHSTPGYDEPAILSFLGLDTTGPDPMDGCTDSGEGGAGGAASTGGTSGKSGSSASGGKSSLSGAGGTSVSSDSTKSGSGGKANSAAASTISSGKGGSSAAGTTKPSGKGGTSSKVTSDASQEQGGAASDTQDEDTSSGGAQEASTKSGDKTKPSSGSSSAPSGSSVPAVQAEPGDAGGCNLMPRNSRTGAAALLAMLTIVLGSTLRRRRR